MTDSESGVFAAALDEVLSPLANPRYVVSRRVLDEPRSRWVALRLGILRGLGLGTAGAEVWHTVPAVLGGRREYAEIFHAAWQRWVSSGRLVYTRSPEGHGILSAQRGNDPFAVTTAVRIVWR